MRIPQINPFRKGFTLVEIAVSSVLISVVALGMGIILVQSQKTVNKQQIIEHVNIYGQEAIRRVSEEIRRAVDVRVTSLLGMSRIHLELPGGNNVPGQKNMMTISASPEEGLMNGRDPLLTTRGVYNAFHYGDLNNHNYLIKRFDCELVPASEGLSGKLSRNFYDLKLQIDVITINSAGEEVFTPLEFHRRVFAVAAYIS